MSNRRTFLQMVSSLPILNGLAGSVFAAPAKRDFLKELGVRPIINGAGVYTMMTASLMIDKRRGPSRPCRTTSCGWTSCMTPWVSESPNFSNARLPWCRQARPQV